MKMWNKNPWKQTERENESEQKAITSIELGIV